MFSLEEERKIKIWYILSVIIGILLSFVVIVLLRTTVVSNIVDPTQKRVQFLICTFEKFEYQAKDVMSNATLETVTHVNIIVDTEFFQFFTRDVSQEDFVDMGIIYWENSSAPAIAPMKLENNTKYVVEEGRIIDLHHYGFPDASPQPCVKIVAIRDTNWLDEFILATSIEISFIVMFLFLIIATLFTLPIAHFYLSRQERLRRKKRKNKEKRRITT